MENKLYNIAISKFTDEIFEKNKAYDIDNIIDNCIYITSRRNKNIILGIDDTDFIFILNATKEFLIQIFNIYGITNYKFE